MEQEKFYIMLRMLELMTANKTLSTEVLIERLGITRRTFYRYLSIFKRLGFIVEKENHYLGFSQESDFYRSICDKVCFTNDEAITINKLLNAVYDNSSQIRHLRAKLSHLYDFNVLAEHGVDIRIASNLSVLFDAIQRERMVVLRNYTSPHSNIVSDRVVEPYLFLFDNSEVRCYELASGQNKTFKISRAEKVEVLETSWEFKKKHCAFYTDLFHFSGERQFDIKLLLGALSYSLLIEEHPAAERELELQDDGRWLLQTKVCSFTGVARFVLGLYDDIEVVDSPEFKHFLNNRITNLYEKFIL